MSKFGSLIQKAREPENQKTGKPEIKKTRNQENQNGEDEEMVNLGVKVSLRRRRHWAAESKRVGKSMTDVIIHALVEEFGEPEE